MKKLSILAFVLLILAVPAIAQTERAAAQATTEAAVIRNPHAANAQAIASATVIHAASHAEAAKARDAQPSSRPK